MQKRITIFDTVRGFTMLSMAGFHACYDLAYLYGWDMPWFTETVFQDIWRASISWVFLFIAGWMCTLSRNNVKRALEYAAAALIVWMATTLVSVDDSVNFGIIYCMAACTAVVALTRPLLQKITGLMGHRSVPCSFCPNLGHSKGGLPTPLPGMAWIPRPGFCFGRLLSAHSVCLYVPYRLLYCPGSTSIKPRSASMGICQSHPGARSPRSACLTVLPAPSACHSRRARARLFCTIALKTRRDSSRQLRHNANAVL